MFTGLIQDVGVITSMSYDEKSQDTRIAIQTKLDAKHLKLGASIANDGVCLTVVGYNDGVYSVQASPETLAKTTLKDWKVGTKLNLEPSLRLGDELGGHLVFGHVDGQALITVIEKRGEYWYLEIKPPQNLMKFIAQKGSISLNGVSLTVNDVFDNYFSIMLIPHSWAHTNFHEKSVGSEINIEIDMLARYADRILNAKE